MKESFYIFEQ